MSNGSDTICAVVGTGCVLPDAFDVDRFWANLMAGRSALRPITSDRIHWDRHYSPDRSAPDRTYSLLAGRVLGYTFDWKRFRMPPVDAAAINPMQLMVLDAGDQALRQLRRVPNDTTGLFLGATGLGWQPDSGLQIRFPMLADAVRCAAAELGVPTPVREIVLRRARATLADRLKPVSDDTVVNASASVALGRIAMYYDLRGLHYAIDAGFASGLAALDVAVRALRDHTIDLAVVGGASELLTPLEMVAFARLGGLASNELAAFDEHADGTVLGEGVAMFALKRLDDALRDGETIYALIRGVGGATDPRGKALIAPNSAGQLAALTAAYADAGVDPRTVRFVECHATGTQLGDRTEVCALREFFPQSDGSPAALVSAKPFVGHLRGAAGAVGMLRAVLALHHGTIPAQIGFRRPHPELGLEGSRFFVPTEPWRIEPDADGAPRAGVSAIGFGGNNFHAVLEAHSPGVRARATSSTARVAAAAEPIAIVGLGGIFPGAENIAAFTKALLDGTDATGEVPKSRWNMDNHYDADHSQRDKSYSRLGCFLEAPSAASLNGAWQIPPCAYASLDPGQLLVLRAAEEALGHAGYAPGQWHAERVAVRLAFLPYQGKKFLADFRINYAEYAVELEQACREAGVDVELAHAWLAHTEQMFKATLPPITEDTLVGYLGSINAARIARHWGFHGPHFVLDSTCASSHAALHAAVQALRHRTADVVVSGGVWCDMMPEFFVAACRFDALSATGIRPFDAAANGFIPGEGTGVVVLQRLADAEREGRTIHAVLRAVAGSTDGRGRSVLAPKPEGEAMAMRRALETARVEPLHVDYVECHGTGTALGDEVEISAYLDAYGRGRARPLLVGSVKSNIGHLNAAAGMPALIKAVLAVRDGIIPPSLKCDAPNPRIDFAAGPVHVVTAPTRWEAPTGQPRRAGVSGFGIGGTNMHLIVEQYRRAEPDGPSLSAAIRAPDVPLAVAVAGGDGLLTCVERLAGLVARAQVSGADAYAALLADAAGAPARRSGAAEQRIAIVASTPDQLASRFNLLLSVLRRGADPAVLRAQGVFIGRPNADMRVAVAFPGQGAHYGGMLRDACGHFPVLGAVLDRIDTAYQRFAGRPLRPAFLYDQDTYSADLPDEDSHCATYAVNCALFELLRTYGLRPHAVIGQSAGELSALVAAGVLTLEDGLAALRERTLAVLQLDVDDPGRMVAVRCGADQARAALAELGPDIVIAADNSPDACLIAGPSAAVNAAINRLEVEGIEATLLAVSHAYHSPRIGGARARYRAALDRIVFRSPMCDVVSTITGQSIRTLPLARYPALLAEQFVLPVRLRQGIDALHTAGVNLFVECGPKWSVTTFVGDILRDRPHIAQATLHPKVGEVEQIHRALACLFVHGAVQLTPYRPVAAAPRAAAAPVPL